jgi:hypothetical protein
LEELEKNRKCAVLNRIPAIKDAEKTSRKTCKSNREPWSLASKPAYTQSGKP